MLKVPNPRAFMSIVLLYRGTLKTQKATNITLQCAEQVVDPHFPRWGGNITLAHSARSK